jgi:hypothetical protein
VYTIVQLSKSTSAKHMREVRDSFLILKTRKPERVFIAHRALTRIESGDSISISPFPETDNPVSNSQ